MNKREFLEIMSSDTDGATPKEGDETLMGLNIMAKYIQGSVIMAAKHDVLYLCDVDELLMGGITREEALKLREYGFMVEGESYLATSFV